MQNINTDTIVESKDLQVTTQALSVTGVVFNNPEHKGS